MRQVDDENDEGLGRLGGGGAALVRVCTDVQRIMPHPELLWHMQLTEIFEAPADHEDGRHEEGWEGPDAEGPHGEQGVAQEGNESDI